MGKVTVTTKRIQGARETVLSYLKSHKGQELRQGEIYGHAATQGFPNQNTVRGRLSELYTEGTIERRKGWGGTVWYKFPIGSFNNECGGEGGYSL